MSRCDAGVTEGVRGCRAYDVLHPRRCGGPGNVVQKSLPWVHAILDVAIMPRPHAPKDVQHAPQDPLIAGVEQDQQHHSALGHARRQLGGPMGHGCQRPERLSAAKVKLQAVACCSTACYARQPPFFVTCNARPHSCIIAFYACPPSFNILTNSAYARRCICHANPPHTPGQCHLVGSTS